jgi:hypothetical protein
MINEVPMQFRHKLITSKHLNGKKCKPNFQTSSKEVQQMQQYMEHPKSIAIVPALKNKNHS